MPVTASPLPAPAGDQAGLIFGKPAAARPEMYVASVKPSERSVQLQSLRQGTADRLRQSLRWVLCANRVVTARREPVVTTREMHQPSTG
jgi:hypothetical protein